VLISPGPTHFSGAYFPEPRPAAYFPEPISPTYFSGAPERTRGGAVNARAYALACGACTGARAPTRGPRA